MAWPGKQMAAKSGLEKERDKEKNDRDARTDPTRVNQSLNKLLHMYSITPALIGQRRKRTKQHCGRDLF